MESNTIEFHKYQGLGNDFIMLDSVHPDRAALVKMCDRNFGIGADGVVVLDRIENSAGDKGPKLRYTIYNRDGGEVETCGNGLRCFVKYAERKGLLAGEDRSEPIIIQTVKKRVEATLLGSGQVKVNMGKADFSTAGWFAHPGTHASEAINICIQTSFLKQCSQLRLSCVSMSNPHCVVFLRDNPQLQQLDKIDLNEFKKLQDSEYFPKGVNIEFVDASSPEKLLVRVLERGAGETYACGSGACAVAAVAKRLGIVGSSTTVKFKGGELQLDVKPDGNIHMIGSAQEVFTGNYSLSSFKN